MISTDPERLSFADTKLLAPSDTEPLNYDDRLRNLAVTCSARAGSSFISLRSTRMISDIVTSSPKLSV
jgi:hypothetical protein